MEHLNKMKLENGIAALVANGHRVDEEDLYIKQDNEDLQYLEMRYDRLRMPYGTRMIVDDYIACMKTRDERYADLSYIAGLRDAIKLLKELGMLASVPTS